MTSMMSSISQLFKLVPSSIKLLSMREFNHVISLPIRYHPWILDSSLKFTPLQSEHMVSLQFIV